MTITVNQHAVIYWKNIHISMIKLSIPEMKTFLLLFEKHLKIHMPSLLHNPLDLSAVLPIFKSLIEKLMKVHNNCFPQVKIKWYCYILPKGWENISQFCSQPHQDSSPETYFPKCYTLFMPFDQFLKNWLSTPHAI